MGRVGRVGITAPSKKLGIQKKMFSGNLNKHIHYFGLRNVKKDSHFSKSCVLIFFTFYFLGVATIAPHPKV